MRSILFVCYGNICRSPMAEFIMKDLVRKMGVEREFRIESRATSAEELGNPVYPPARMELQKHGIDCTGKVAMRLSLEDYTAFDLILVMDSRNRRAVLRMTDGDPEGKVHMMSEHTAHGDVDDPWFTRRFDIAWQVIADGCAAWLDHLFSR